MKSMLILGFFWLFFTQISGVFAQTYLSNAQLEGKAGYYQRSNQTDSANYYYQMLIDRYEFTDEDKYIVWQQMLINNLLNNQQIDMALALGQSLSKSVTTLQNKLKVDLSLAFIYFLKYDLKKSLEINEAILKTSTAQSAQQARAYLGLASVYTAQNFLYLALEYEHQVERIYLAEPNTSKIALANLYKSLANNYISIQNYGLAEQYLQKIPQVLDLTQNPNQKLLHLSGLASLQEAQGNYRGALGYYLQGLALQKNRYSNLHPSFYGSYVNLNQVYLKIQQSDSAYYYLQAAESLAQRVFASKSVNWANLQLYKAQYYQATGQADSALVSCQRALIANHPNFDDLDIRQNPPTANCLDEQLLAKALQLKAQILVKPTRLDSQTRQSVFELYQLIDQVIQKNQRLTRQNADQLRLAATADQFYNQAIEGCWVNK
jgi:hypothetical protein